MKLITLSSFLSVLLCMCFTYSRKSTCKYLTGLSKALEGEGAKPLKCDDFKECIKIKDEIKNCFDPKLSSELREVINFFQKEKINLKNVFTLYSQYYIIFNWYTRSDMSSELSSLKNECTTAMEDYKKFVKEHMDEKFEGTLYRGLLVQEGNNTKTVFTKDEKVTNFGFLSTSKKNDIPTNFFKNRTGTVNLFFEFVGTSTKKIKGKDISAYSPITDEQEVLIDSDQTFIVTSVINTKVDRFKVLKVTLSAVDYDKNSSTFGKKKRKFK